MKIRLTSRLLNALNLLQQTYQGIEVRLVYVRSDPNGSRQLVFVRIKYLVSSEDFQNGMSDVKDTLREQGLELETKFIPKNEMNKFTSNLLEGSISLDSVNFVFSNQEKESIEKTLLHPLLKEDLQMYLETRECILPAWLMIKPDYDKSPKAILSQFGIPSLTYGRETLEWVQQFIGVYGILLDNYRCVILLPYHLHVGVDKYFTVDINSNLIDDIRINLTSGRVRSFTYESFEYVNEKVFHKINIDSLEGHHHFLISIYSKGLDLSIFECDYRISQDIMTNAQNIEVGIISSEVNPQSLTMIFNTFSAVTRNNIEEMHDNSSVNNNSETNKTEKVTLTNKKGIQIYTETNGDNNEIKNHVWGNVLIGEAISKLDPVFANSIEEFSSKLDSLLQLNKIPKINGDELKRDLLKLSKEYEEVKPDQKLADAEKRASIVRILRGIAFKLVDLSPVISQFLLATTPFAPFAIPIGQSVTFTRDLIEHELNAPKMIPSIKVDNSNGISVVNIVNGSGIKIENSISEFSNRLSNETGLLFLTHDYFDVHVDCSSNFSNWVEFGTPFSLASIYQNKEYRREALLNEIKERLDKYNKILLFGGPGVSKSTIVMEIICDFLKNHSNLVVLYNLNSYDGIIKNLDQIEKTIIDLLNGEHLVLITVDDCHTSHASLIFILIKKIEELSPTKKNNIKILLAAREPDFTNLIDSCKDVNVAEAMDLMVKSKKFTRSIGIFSPNEVKEFVQKYEHLVPQVEKDKGIEKFSNEIYSNTRGYPIMVKFFLSNKGLSSHVKRMYTEYMLNSEGKIETDIVKLWILNSIFDITALSFTDELLNYFGFDEASLKLENSIIRKENDTWKTIHPMWDIFLFRHLFSLKSLAFREIEKQIKYIITSFLNCRKIDVEDKVKMLYTIYNTLTDHKVATLNTIERIISSEEVIDRIQNEKTSLIQILVNVLGRAYIKTEDVNYLNKALKLFDRAIEIDPAYSNSYNLKGITLTDLGKPGEAIDNFDLAIDRNPSDYRLYVHKGIAISKLSHENQIKCYDEALKINPDYANAYYNKGHAFEIDKNPEEALLNYDRALKSNPYDSEAYNNKGNILGRQGRYREAIECYDRVIEINPNHIKAYFNRGQAFEHFNKMKAVEDYDRVLEFDSSDIEAENAKGNALIDLERPDEAKICFEHVLENQPKNEAAIFGLSVTLERIKKLNG